MATHMSSTLQPYRATHIAMAGDKSQTQPKSVLFKEHNVEYFI